MMEVENDFEETSLRKSSSNEPIIELNKPEVSLLIKFISKSVPKVVRLEKMDEHEVIWLFFLGYL